MESNHFLPLLIACKKKPKKNDLFLNASLMTSCIITLHCYSKQRNTSKEITEYFDPLFHVLSPCNNTRNTLHSLVRRRQWNEMRQNFLTKRGLLQLHYSKDSKCQIMHSRLFQCRNVKRIIKAGRIQGLNLHRMRFSRCFSISLICYDFILFLAKLKYEDY